MGSFLLQRAKNTNWIRNQTLMENCFPLQLEVKVLTKDGLLCFISRQ